MLSLTIRRSIFRTYKRLVGLTTSSIVRLQHSQNEDDIFLEEDSDDYKSLVQEYIPTSIGHKCYVVHPYIKWGPRKLNEVKPSGQLEEAVSLIKTLHSWKVVDAISVPLTSLDKKTIFGKGNMEKLQSRVRKDSSISSVFVNVGTLKIPQQEELQRILQVPVFDRYNIVMQILKAHAKSKHAKLQVALAEIPYIRNRMSKGDGPDFDTRRLMLQNREQKLKEAIKKLRSQRELLRNRRTKVSFPIVAVVGYTNAGKTSLIKALTHDSTLEPKDELFATLDVTLHAGLLPSNLKVLYVDTVGFLSDIPTGLIECFIATLEDAILADVILHVEDLSSENFTHQRNHVTQTLNNLGNKMGSKDVLNKVISIGNKCDLEQEKKDCKLKVSATKEIGVDVLREDLENAIIKLTNRHVLKLNIPIGGEEIRWLYKNATVVSTEEDPDNSENQIVKIIITSSQISKFKHNFC